MSALNAVAFILGWTFIGIVCLAIVVGVVIGLWQWLTEQIWLAGERIDRRRSEALANQEREQ